MSKNESIPNSSLRRTQEKNLAKLEQVDFHNLDHATDEFTDLRKHLEGMNRKLSLTSGVLAEGNHVRADLKVLEQMNREDNDNEEEDDDSGNLSLDKKYKESKQEPIDIRKQFPDMIQMENEDEVQKIQRIFSAFNQEDSEAIQSFMLTSIAYQTRRKIKEHCMILLDHYNDLNMQELSSRKQKEMKM